jgi:spermidine/putrescine transport system substrate-binding protein
VRTVRLLTWPGMPAREAIAEAARRAGVHAEIEAVSSNERLLERMDDAGHPYDVVFPSDYMIGRLRGDGRLRTIDTDALPLDQLAGWARAAPHDPGCRHSVPFAFGTTGYVHDERLRGATGWGSLFDPPAGVAVGMLDEVREVVGAALLACGHSPNSIDDAALADAGALLGRQRERVARYDSDDFLTPLIEGAVAAHHAWSGPAALALRAHPHLSYVLPAEGAMVWVTAAAIPSDAPAPDLSLELVRELMDPELASLTTAMNGYSTPNEAARALLDAELRTDPVLFPPEETLGRCHIARDLGADESRLTAVWAALAAPVA